MSHSAPFQGSGGGRARRTRAIHHHADRRRPLDRPLRLEALEDRRLLAGVVVGNNFDLVNGNTTTIATLIANAGGDGISLREAILAANGTAGADVITFAPALSGQTITLGGTELAIGEALTIDARPLAANVTINANQLSRIFNITATTGDFTLGGLTLTRGRTTGNNLNNFDTTFRGGAVRSVSIGNLTLDQSTVSGSSTTGAIAVGGGVFTSGAVTLNQSTVSGNSTAGFNGYGGGIHANGRVTLTQSTVSGNSTSGQGADGGGIKAGAVTLIQSTVSGNSTSGGSADGGGIWAGDVTLTQSTVSGNSTSGLGADGGGIWAYVATLTQSTVTNNRALHATATGGGVHQVDSPANYPISVSNSIVAGNTAGGGGPDLVKDPQSTLTVNYSLIGTGIVPTAGGNNVATDVPQLAPLANNGGLTLTHATLAASPAINAGDPGIVFNPAEFDQRGGPFVRVFGGRMDIGAYERQTVAGLNLVVDATDDFNDSDLSAGRLSLREAIGLANGSIGADVITFVPALGGQTITLGGTELAISDALVIDARPLAANVTINANQLSRIFNITATTGDFILGGLTLTRGRTFGNNTNSLDTTFSGGAVRSVSIGNLTIDQGAISGNSTSGNEAGGGGIYGKGAVTLTQSTVSGNSTSGGSADGGGIWAGDVTLTQSTVSGNSTSGNYANGGGIYGKGAVTLTQSTVSGNSTTEDFADGGGIFGGAVTLTQSTVSGNSTSGNYADGGGIWASAVTLIQSTISGNSTSGLGAGGGGVFAVTNVTLIQSTVTNNHASYTGGGVHQFEIPLNFIYPISVSNSIVTGNTAGGGDPNLFKDPQSPLTVNYSLIGAGINVPIGNNVATNNPQLAPLTNNGGPTQTHAPLAASPAINAGDPGVVFNSAEFDQRGGPFVRVFGGRMDIGAYERQTVAGLNLVVDATDDLYDFDFSAGNLSLREAIGLANGSFGADTVTFAGALSGATIALGGAELEISETLTIDARPLPANVTVDAQQLSRIFNITATTGDFTLGGLTPTRGRTTASSSPGSGGAIRSLTTGSLTIDQSTISGNSTTGALAMGGGIYGKGNVTLTQSTVSGNSTAGGSASGGGIGALGDLMLTQSIVSGNSTTGYAGGGGIYGKGAVTLTQSTVSGNSTTKPFANGGGILTSFASLTLIQSTVSGNSTGLHGKGGGIFAYNVTLIQSSVSGNTVSGSGGRGGGIAAAANVTLTQSTVSGNVGGVFHYGGLDEAVTITGSILAGNGSDFAVLSPNPTYLIVNFSLIGTGVTPNLGANNVVSDNPMLGPLAFNGGPTQTRALLPGSPAIDAGDPAIVFNPAESDQRGAPFVRVVDGDAVVGARIDIGAFELQPTPAPSADFDSDGDRDGADFLAWQRGFGATGAAATKPNGNADYDNDVDGVDLMVWTSMFGSATAASELQAAADGPRRAELSAAIVDAAMAYDQMLADAAPRRPFGPRLLRAR